MQYKGALLLMQTIHLKTVDPLSQELLRSASQQGIELSWDRFEKLQPQDGFLRLGLSCPFGCMQGPCRIDPLGRGPGKGVCGLGKDEMAAALLLRLCLQGTMEALAGVPSGNDFAELRLSSTLDKMVKRALSKNDRGALSVHEIVNSSNLLHRPSSSCESLLSQALRLCLLTLGLQEQGGRAAAAESVPCTVGYGTVSGASVRIGLCGRPAPSLLDGLGKARNQDASTPERLVSLGDWILSGDRFLPIGSSSGEAELLLSSGAIHLLVAGPGTDPGLLELCKNMNIPVVREDSRDDAGDIWERARRSCNTRSQVDLFSAAPGVQEGRVLMSEKDFRQRGGVRNDADIAIIGGSDNPQVTLGSLPVELAAGLQSSGLQIAGWGDAALWLLKAGSDLQGQSTPLMTLENCQGPLHAVKGLESEGQLSRLRGICFTGMSSCQELAAALGLAYLGCRVSLATPIPLQGSRTAMATLAEMLGVNGGQLLHFDHPAQPGELIEWFTAA